MRILLINPNTTASITESIAAYACRIAGGEATFVPVTARFGARYIASRAASTIAAHAALDALAAHVEGCDAVYLACFGDPGLPALKEVSPAPVVGMAEAACRAAAQLGRFAIVTGGALWQAMMREYVESLGLADRLASIRVVAATGDQIAQDPEAALADLTAACVACATEDGAQVVVLGGAALAGLAARIQHRVPVPVLCSVEVGANAVVAAARAARSSRDASLKAVGSIGLSPALEALLGRPSG